MGLGHDGKLASEQKKTSISLKYVIPFLGVTALGGYFLGNMDVFSHDNSKQESVPSSIVADSTDKGSSGDSQESDNSLKVGMAIGEYKGDKVELFQSLDKLYGYSYREGVAAEDTVYIIFDPRCPFCHQMYNKLEQIDLEKKGINVKWLPILAFGSNGLSDPIFDRVFAIINAENKQQFEAAFNDNIGPLNLTDEQKKVLLIQMKGSDAAIKAGHRSAYDTDKAYVPAAFFIEKQTGKQHFLSQDLVDDKVFKSIFGEFDKGATELEVNADDKTK